MNALRGPLPNCLQRREIHSLLGRLPTLSRQALFYRRSLHVKNNGGRSLLQVSPEVKEGLQSNKAVVALESTIITHGMPYPDNLSTAVSVEKVVREHGAIPATVAVIGGSIHVGLNNSELQQLAESKSKTESESGTGSIKTSRRDLPYVLSQGLSGGTTVSGTMVAAHKAGVPVFVTGGIGGVHRGAESTMDVSADLTELGRTPVAVVSAGVKSILDIGRTLEYLETQGVCVATFGPTKDFPAFFTPHSGFKSPYNVTSPAEAAQLINASLSLSLQSGVFIAVPIPEHYAADGGVIEDAIKRAVHETVEKGVSGKDVTPYILQRVNDLTEGKSLSANIALVKNNAKVGAQIAVELAKIRSQSESQELGQRSFTVSTRSQSGQTDTLRKRPVIIGGTNVDFTAKFSVENQQPDGATYPGSVQQSAGGVGRNVADCLSRLGGQPLFISLIGADSHADTVRLKCAHMDLKGIQEHPSLPTATYCAVQEKSGELIYGIGDFQIHAEISPKLVSKFEEDLATAPLVCFDGNIPAQTMTRICRICHSNNVPVWFEPTNVLFIRKLFDDDQVWKRLTYASPNLNELRELNACILGQRNGNNGHASEDETGYISESSALEESLTLVTPILDHIPNVLVTLGRHGVLVCRDTEASQPFPTRGSQELKRGPNTAVHYPAETLDTPSPVKVSVSGAGDCLAAAVMSGILQGAPVEQCLKSGLLAAHTSLGSYHAVPSQISPQILSAEALRKFAPWTPRTLL